MPAAAANAQEHSCHGYDTAKTAQTRYGHVEIQGGQKAGPYLTAYHSCVCKLLRCFECELWNLQNTPLSIENVAACI